MKEFSKLLKELFFVIKISSIFSYGDGFTDDDHNTIFNETKVQ